MAFASATPTGRDPLLQPASIRSPPASFFSVLAACVRSLPPPPGPHLQDLLTAARRTAATDVPRSHTLTLALEAGGRRTMLDLDGQLFMSCTATTLCILSSRDAPHYENEPVHQFRDRAIRRSRRARRKPEQSRSARHPLNGLTFSRPTRPPALCTIQIAIQELLSSSSLLAPRIASLAASLPVS